MSFEQDLSAFTAKYKRRGDQLVRKVVLDVATQLVMKSPVGDASYWIMPAPPGYVGGRFRANWQYGEGAFHTTTTEETDASRAETIGSIVGKVKASAAGKIHFITNSLPYAKRLEDGWSRQAPIGMVHLTILEFRPIVEKVARQLNR